MSTNPTAPHDPHLVERLAAKMTDRERARPAFTGKSLVHPENQMPHVFSARPPKRQFHVAPHLVNPEDGR